MTTADPIRFAEILTTASAVANYFGEPDVLPAHLIDAVAILRGDKTLDDLGRPLSPLVRRTPPGQSGGVEPRLRALIQSWFAHLENDPTHELTQPELEAFLADVTSLR